MSSHPDNQSNITQIGLEPLISQLKLLSAKGSSALLPALHAAQDMYGHLPEPVVTEVGRQLNVPLADVNGVIDFYSMFYKQPVGKKIVRVCCDPPCGILGGTHALAQLLSHLNISPNEATSDGQWTVEQTPCLGLCDHSPAALVGPVALSQINPDDPQEILDLTCERATTSVNGDIRILTKNCGRGTPTDLDQYLTSGGYAALRKSLLQMRPADIIQEIKNSGLVGRGGAAFPTGIKWEGAANAPGDPKYIVCNADESEPGTFKDRVLMQDDPHSTLEGMIIAGYCIGAHKGYLYIRGEYMQAARILEQAITEAINNGYLGHNILDSGFDFTIELRRGAGAYICGEETALFESIEGRRGFPRVKPPFPTTHGLFGRPTIINNVETLCNVPMIINEGADAFRKYGTETSPGPKLFCLSGDVAQPGLYEVPFGVTLRHVLEDLAGGVTGGSMKAALFGGAAGAFATERHLDVPMTFEDLRAAGLPLGSGVVMVFNETRDMRQVLKGLTHFFADESCGKCYPCQLGTQRQYEIISRIASGQTQASAAQTLNDVGWTMTDASLCGLGQTAATAVLSAMDLWPEIFRENGK